jgi:hypothetical protein
LKANIWRLTAEILPLHPDMIISYHGYNGFGMIRGIVPLSHRYVGPISQLLTYRHSTCPFPSQSVSSMA